jgi:hypothetical protein
MVLNFMMLYRVEPLLCDDREIGKCTRAVPRQRLDKHVPAETTVEILLETGCFLRGPCRGADPVNSARKFVKRVLEPDADE